MRHAKLPILICVAAAPAIALKSDFDFPVSLYELRPEGDYFQLAPFWSRASYVQDLAHRNLLVAGKRQTLDFRSHR